MELCVSFKFYSGILVVLFLNNVKALESEHIIGDQYAAKGHFKYHVSIQVDGTSICGGSLIASDIVMTAGHCVCNRKGEIQDEPFKVIAGTTDLSVYDHKRRVSKIYTLKGFQVSDKNTVVDDIAILRLESGFNLNKNSNIALVQLPTRSVDYTGVAAVTAGFGWNNVEKVWNKKSEKFDLFGQSDGRLKYVEVKVTGDVGCFKGLPYYICGRAIQNPNSGYQGVCKRDSGGSLVSENVAIAILSTGDACDDTKIPAIFTKVSLYLDFIDAAMSDVKLSNMKVLSPSGTIINRIFNYFTNLWDKLNI